MEDKLLALPPIQEPPKKLPPVDLFLGLKDHGLQDQKFEIKIVQAFEVPIGNLFGMQVRDCYNLVGLLMCPLSYDLFCRCQQRSIRANNRLGRHERRVSYNLVMPPNGKRTSLSTLGFVISPVMLNFVLPSTESG